MNYNKKIVEEFYNLIKSSATRVMYQPYKFVTVDSIYIDNRISALNYGINNFSNQQLKCINEQINRINENFI